jgi:peptide-methionine (S)-S-oxide reductase
VIRTRVGYAGGDKVNPTYYDLGNHSETIEIDYDPAVISYERLLDVFWDSHNPTVPAYSTQYKSIIFYHDEEQRRLAVESKARQESEKQSEIYTEIVPYSEFYLAEDYHQKYCLSQEYALMKELTEIYPDMESFVNSTAVARLNGYACGYGSSENLQEDIDNLGLSEAGAARILELAEKRGLRPGCPLPE